MSSMAKISAISLKEYSDSVHSISDFSAKVSDSVCVFDELISSLDQEIDQLSKCVESLEEADKTVDNKIEQYSNEKDELEREISDLENELRDAESELASTEKYITVGCDDDGNGIVVPNPAAVALEAKIASIGSKLAIKNTQRLALIEKIERCQIMKGRINSLMLQIRDKVSSLELNKNNVIKNRDQFETNRRKLYENSSLAIAKLNTIDRVLNDYMNARLRVASAYERADIGNKNLNDVEYLTTKYKQFEKNNGLNKARVDDNESIYKTKDGLVPNSKFIKNGYTFVTDNQGRTISASGKLRLAQEKKNRNWDSSLEEIGKGYEKKKDEIGHIIGHRFDGPDSILNAVPQNCNINRGAYKSFENSLVNYLNNGKDVYVDIRPVYSGESHRPDSIVAVFTVDGVMNMRFFPNEGLGVNK